MSSGEPFRRFNLDVGVGGLSLGVSDPRHHPRQPFGGVGWRSVDHLGTPSWALDRHTAGVESWR